jgi:hypothetical protein
VIGIEKGVWVVRERARPLWDKVQSGDKVVFYAVRTSVLGYGTAEGKFESRELLWPEEKERARANLVAKAQDKGREGL